MNINVIQELVDKDGVVFLTYGGFLSQPLISAMTEALEKEASVNNLNLSISSNIFTIFIELSQNMMNYSKTKTLDDNSFNPHGLIVVGKDEQQNYFIHSQNIIDIDDKNKIEPVLIELKTMSLDEIKQRYKELRRSGKNTHGKGGGIGFYEIAKRCDSVDYEFKLINENKFYFHFEAKVKNKIIGE